LEKKLYQENLYFQIWRFLGSLSRCLELVTWSLVFYVETRRNILGGNPEDPIPYAVSYRVGCEKCNYELTSETIDI